MTRLWERLVSLAGSNLGLKVLSLVIAMGLWVAGHRDIERAIEVPVEFRNIPSDLMVMDNRIDYVVLRLTGPRTLISTLDARDLKLPLDLNDAKAGSRSYTLSPSSFVIPRGVTIARITPPIVHLRLEPIIKRAVPVTVRFTGKPAYGYRVTEAVAEPKVVSVEGPAVEVKRLSSVETIAIDVEESRTSIKRKIRLATDGKPVSFAPDQVEVLIAVEEEEILREFGRVPVAAKDFSGEYSVSPSSLYLRLAGPKHILGKLDVGSDQVYLDLKGLGRGEHLVAPRVSLPPEVKVMEQKPRQFKVRIMKPAV
jgi:YbbR domain-containing protein